MPSVGENEIVLESVWPKARLNIFSQNFKHSRGKKNELFLSSDSCN